MATIIFLLDNHMVSGRRSEKDVITKVNDVKGNKYSNDEIQKYYRLLKEKAYIQ